MFSLIASDANLGSIGGQKFHAISLDEMATHSHGISTSTPANFSAVCVSDGKYVRVASIASDSWIDQDLYNSYNGATGVIANGNSTPFSLMQPSLYLNYVVKV